jgi:hypothetical protein
MRSGPDIDRGRVLLAAIKRELTIDDPMGWSSDDLHELFDAWGFRRQWLYSGYDLRYAVDADAKAVVPASVEKLPEYVINEAVEAVEKAMAKWGIPS